MEVAYIYTIDTGGIDTEEAYPYEGMQGKCRFKKNKVMTSIRSVMRVEKGSEADLQAAVALEGPVALAVDGNHNAFRVSEGRCIIIIISYRWMENPQVYIPICQFVQM